MSPDGLSGNSRHEENQPFWRTFLSWEMINFPRLVWIILGVYFYSSSIQCVWFESLLNWAENNAQSLYEAMTRPNKRHEFGT